MLLRFGVSNHRSIRDYQELFLSASPRIKRNTAVFPVPTLREHAVPVVAIYGANAAGKSNLVDAIDHFQGAIVRSHQGLSASSPIPRSPFMLDESGLTRPTRLDCTFTVEEQEGGDRIPRPFPSVYEYGFEFTDRQFEREWLVRVTRKERQSTHTLFERKTTDGQVQIQFGSQLRGENRTIRNLTRPNSLFLSAASQNNHPQLSRLFRYFEESWRTAAETGPLIDRDVAERLFDYPHMARLLRLVRQADVGISEVTVEDDEVVGKNLDMARDLAEVFAKHFGGATEHGSMEEAELLEQFRQSKTLKFIHGLASGGRPAFGYDMESKGTRTLISFLIPALEALSRGQLLVIDELDTSLHPGLARAFVSLFSKATANPRGAQLVFTTHDVTLLSSDLIHQDEIWMADKDREGTSRFTPLTDFDLRSRDNIERAYRFGRLGGVPFGDEFAVDFDDHPDTPAP